MAQKTNCLVTTNRIKELNRAKGFNTSAEVSQQLTDFIENVLHLAHVNAIKEGRKTIMGRDIKYAREKLGESNG